MLGLKLRPEFLTSQMRGTQIQLGDYVAAASAEGILSITYPTADVRRALIALATAQGRPVILIGERGRGKSHIMAVLHHAFLHPDEVEGWAKGWADRVDDAAFTALDLPRGFKPISVVMSDQEYRTLWEPIFAAMPDGKRYEGRFEGAGTPVPSRSLMEEACAAQPIALILDELQTWFESLKALRDGGAAAAQAFNFIQILAELAADRPDILRLVISVRNSETEAFQQVYRNTPVLVDFAGVNARKDRVKLLQHRLFENYAQIDPASIRAAASAYGSERARLLFPGAVGPVQLQEFDEVIATWPFSPELVTILEDDFLMAAAAQGTRDLMRVLVRLYRVRGDRVPILAVSDLDVSNPDAGGEELAGVLDTVQKPGTKLRQIAQRNLQALQDQGLTLAHATELISALWVRSLTQGPKPGAEPQQLHLDVTRSIPIDDNAFDEELQKLIEGSFNIHQNGTLLLLREDENARTKVIASARNSKQFADGKDQRFIRQLTAATLNPAESATAAVSRLIVLGPSWEHEPWSSALAEELPGTWRVPTVLVLPEFVEEERLARWLREQVSERRNLVRFFMPGPAGLSPYKDPELVETARRAVLAQEWASVRGADPQYAQLHKEFRGSVQAALRRRFERLALLRRWDFASLAGTHFTVERVTGDGQGPLKAIEDEIERDVFEPDRFRRYVLAKAAERRNAFDIIAELMEPPASPEEDAIPFLGETALYERILKMVGDGLVVIQKEGAHYRREQGETAADTYVRIRGRAWASGSFLKEVTVLQPQDVAARPPSPDASDGPGALLGGAASVAAGQTTTTQPNLEYPARTYGPSGQISEIADEPAAPVKIRVLNSTGARSPLNLQGDLHSWNLAGRSLRSTRLEIRDLPEAGLFDILKRLPPTLRLTLQVEVDEAEERS